MAGPVLYTFGLFTFELYPMNVHEVSHNTASDWARKEIAGAANYREWVGEGDEEVHLKGRVFPHFFAKHTRDPIGPLPGSPNTSGGLGHLDVLDNIRRLGQAHALGRGGQNVHYHLGWFIIESLRRGHSFLAPDGIGQLIEFEATFQRVPVPEDPAAYFSQIWASIV